MIIELLQRNNYYPYKYQIDAIKQALAIIENHNGVAFIQSMQSLIIPAPNK